MSIRIEVEDHPDPETENVVTQGLRGFNAAKAGPSNLEDLWIIARDAQDQVQGGLKGRISRSWFFVERLWVSEAVRGTGVGRGLMERAEAIARKRDCIGCYLDTFSFQSPEFYYRLGYKEFGRIEDFPPGYTRFWLKKRL